jgi:DNA-binding MarR family transcriptional regulator
VSRESDREAAVDRFVQLRPAVLAKMHESVPPELSAEFESITVHQLKALVALPDEGLTMHELACTLGITGATTCALADRLVAQGLAVRTADPADRRVVRLRASERGAELAGRHRQARRRSVAALFELLSDEQVAAWLDIMETLAGVAVAVGR